MSAQHETRPNAYLIPSWAIAEVLARTMTRAIDGLGLIPPCDFCWHNKSAHTAGPCTVRRMTFAGIVERCQCVQFEVKEETR